MAKDSLDDMNLDDDMWSDLDSDDFSFDGDFDNDGSPVDKNGDRSPIVSHIKSVGADLVAAGKGAAEGASAGIKDTVNREFPEVDNFANFAMKGLADAERAKDDILKQVTPVLKDAKATARKFSQLGENAFPNVGVFKKISALLEEPKDDYREKKASIEEMRNSAIDSELSKVFAAQAQERAIDRKEATIERLIDKRESRANNAQLTALIGEIRTDTLFTASFMRSSATAYMKKSLELKYRHLFVAQDTLEALKLTTKSMEVRLDAIKHNTALPDAQKIRLMERAVNARKEKIVSSLSDQASKMFDHARKKIMEDYVTPALDNFSLLVDSMDMSADMLEQGQEMGLSGRDMAIGQAGGFFGGKLGSDIAKRLIRKIPKHVRQTLRDAAKGGPTTIMSRLNRIKNGTYDYGDDDDGDGGILRKILEVAAGFIPDVDKGHGGFTNTAYSNALGDGKITNKFVRTVEEVIPKYLSMQTKYLEQLVTGKPAEEKLWDWKTNKLVGVGELQKDLKTRVFGVKEQHNAVMLDSANQIREAISATNYDSIDAEASQEYTSQMATTFEGISADFTFALLNLAHAKMKIEPRDVDDIENFSKTGQHTDFTEVFFSDIKNPKAVAKKMAFIFKDPKGRLNQSIFTKANNRIDDLMKGFQYEIDRINADIVSLGYESTAAAGNILTQDKNGNYSVNDAEWKKQFKFTNQDLKADRKIEAQYWGTDLETSREKFQKMKENVIGMFNDLGIGEKWEEFKEWMSDGIIGFVAKRFDMKPEEIEEQIEEAKKWFKNKKDWVVGKFNSLKEVLKKPAHWAIKILSDKMAENPDLEPFRVLIFTSDGTLRDDPISAEEIVAAIDKTGAIGDWCMNFIMEGSSLVSWAVRETLMMNDTWHDVLLMYDREMVDRKKKEKEKEAQAAKYARLIGTTPDVSGRGMNINNTSEAYAKKLAEHDGIVIGDKTFSRDKTTGKFKVESEAELKNLLSQREDLGIEDVDVSALRDITKRKTTYEKVDKEDAYKRAEKNKAFYDQLNTKWVNNYAESGFVTPYTLEEIVGTRLDKIISIMGGTVGAKATISKADYDKAVAEHEKRMAPKMKGTTTEYKAYEGMDDAAIVKKIMGNKFMYSHYAPGGLQEQAKKDREEAIKQWSGQQVEDYFKSVRFDRNIDNIPYQRDGMKFNITRNDKGQFLIDSEEALIALIDNVGGLNFITDIDIKPWIDREYEKTGVKFTDKELLVYAEKQLGAKYSMYQEETKQYAKRLTDEEAKKNKVEKNSEVNSWTIGTAPTKDSDKKLDVKLTDDMTNEQAMKAIHEANQAARKEKTEARKKALEEKQKAMRGGEEVKNATVGNANKVDKKVLVQAESFIAGLNEIQSANMQEWILDNCPSADPDEAKIRYYQHCMNLETLYKDIISGDKNPKGLLSDYKGNRIKYEYIYQEYIKNKSNELGYGGKEKQISALEELSTHGAATKLGIVGKGNLTQNQLGVVRNFLRQEGMSPDTPLSSLSFRQKRKLRNLLNKFKYENEADIEERKQEIRTQRRDRMAAMLRDTIAASDTYLTGRKKDLYVFNGAGANDTFGTGDSFYKSYTSDWEAADKAALDKELLAEKDEETEKYYRQWTKEKANKKARGGTISSITGQDAGTVNGPTLIAGGNALAGEHGVETIVPHNRTDDAIRAYLEAKAYHEGNTFARGGTIRNEEPIMVVDGVPCYTADEVFNATKNKKRKKKKSTITDEDVKNFKERKNKKSNKDESVFFRRMDRKLEKKARKYEARAKHLKNKPAEATANKFVARHIRKIQKGIKPEYRSEEPILVIDGKPCYTADDIEEAMVTNTKNSSSIVPEEENESFTRKLLKAVADILPDDKPQENTTASNQTAPTLEVVSAAGEQKEALTDRVSNFFKNLPDNAKEKGANAIDKIKKAAIEQGRKAKGAIDRKLSEKDFGFGEDILDKATKEMNENFIQQQAKLNPTLNEKQNEAVNNAIKSGSDKAADKLEKLGLDGVAQAVREHGAGFDANEAIATVKDKAAAAKDYVTAKIQALWGKLKSLTTKNTFKEIWDSVMAVFDATSEDVEVAEKLSPDDRVFLKNMAESINSGDYRLVKLEIPDDASPALKNAIMLLQDKICEAASNMSEEELAKSNKNSFLGGMQDRIAKSARNFLDNEHVQGAIGWAKVSWNNFKDWVPKIPEMIMKKLADLFSLGKEKMIDVVTDIRALTNIIAMKTVGGENFDIDAIKNIEVMSIKTKLPMSERIWRATKKGVKGIAKGAKWAVTQPLSAARHLITNKKVEVFAKPAVSESLNRAKHVRITDEDWVNGVYHDVELKKPCKSVADIKGVVYNCKGEPLFTEAEYDRGLITADGEPIKNLGSRVGRMWHNTAAFAGSKAMQAGKWGLSKIAKIPGFEIAKKGFNLAKNIVGAPFQIYKGAFVKYKDVYLKDAVANGPLVTAREFKSGLVVFMDGKPIKDVYSIDKPVKYTEDPANGDLAGQYAITNEHLNKGLVDEKNKPIAKFGNKLGALLGRGVMGVGKMLRGLGGITGKVLSTLWGIAASGGKKLLEKKYPFIDVYNSDGKLLLLGRDIKENKYVFESGKPVESAYIITEEVYDREHHNKMVTKEDIEKGLYDVKHHKLSKWRGRSIAFKAATAGFVGAKWAVGKAWGGLKKIGKMLGGKGKSWLAELGEGGSKIFDYFHNKMIETVDAIKNARAVTPKDLESIVGERLDKMLALLEKIKENGLGASKSVDLRGIKGNKRIRKKIAKQQMEKAKKVGGDKDGDGIRDNSYEDQMRKKKEKEAKEKEQAAGRPGVGALNVPGAVGEAAGEEGGGILGSLGDIWDAISTGGDIKDAIKNSRIGQKARNIGRRGKILAGKTKRGFGRALNWATGGRASRAYDAAKDKISGKLGQYGDKAKGFGQDVLDRTKDNLSQYKDKGRDLYDRAKGKAGQYGDKIKDKAGQYADRAKDKLGQYGDKAKEFGGKALDKAKDKLGPVGERVQGWGGRAWNGIKNVGSTIADKAKGIMGTIGKSKIGGALGKVGGKIAGAIAGRVAAIGALGAAGAVAGALSGAIFVAGVVGTAYTIYQVGKWLFADSDAEKSFEKIRYEAYGVSDDYDDEVEDLEEELFDIITGERQPFTDEELDDWAEEFDFDPKSVGMADFAVAAVNPLAGLVSMAQKGKSGAEKAEERRKDYFKIWMQKRMGPIYNVCYMTMIQALGKKPGDEVDWDDIDDIEGGDEAKIRTLNLMRERMKQILAQPAIEGVPGITLKDIKPDKDSYMKFLKIWNEKEKEKEEQKANTVSEIKYDDVKGEYYFTVGDKRFADKDKTKLEKMRIDEMNRIKAEKHKKEANESGKTGEDNAKTQEQIDEYKKKSDEKLKQSQDKAAATAGVVAAAAEAASKDKIKTKVPAKQNSSNVPEQSTEVPGQSKGFLNTLADIAILANPVGLLLAAGKWLFGDSDAEKSFNKIRFEAYGVEEKYDDEIEDLEEDIFDIFFDGDSPLDEDAIIDYAKEFDFFGKASFVIDLLKDPKLYKEATDRRLTYFKTWLERRFMPIYRLCYTKLVAALGKKPGDDIDWDDIDDIKGDDKVKAAFIKNLSQGINQILSGPAFPENTSSNLTIRDIKPTEEAYGKFVNEILANKAKDVTEKAGHKISKIEYDENNLEYFFTVDGKRFAAGTKLQIEKLYIDTINKLKLEKHTASVQEQKASQDDVTKTQAEIDAYKKKSDDELKNAQNKASSEAGVVSGGPTSNTSSPSNSSKVSSVVPAGTTSEGRTAYTPVANNAAGAAVSGSILAGAMLTRPVSTLAGAAIQTLTGGSDGAPSQAAQQSTRIDTSAMGNLPSNIDREKLARQFLNTKLTRGIRNNNPMNVTVSPWSRKQPGFIDADRTAKSGPGSRTPAPIGQGKYGMCRFAAPEYGIAAAVRLIKDVYAGKGKTTIKAITYYYSPPSENDTEGLIRAYCQASGFKPNEPINWDNQQACFAYVKMIIRRESGKAYSDDLIMRGFMMGIGQADNTGAVKSDNAQAVSAEDAKQPKQESIPANVSSPSVGTPTAQPVEKKEAPKLDTVPKAPTPVSSSLEQIANSSSIRNAAVNQSSTTGASSVQASSSSMSLSVSGGASSAPVATPTAGSISGGAAGGAMTGAMIGASVGTTTGAGIPGASTVPPVDMSQIPASATPPKGDVNELGSYVSKYESGSKGSACVAYDREGGTSYGTYQLSSRRGSLKEFIQWCQSKAPEVYSALNPYLAQANTGSKTGDFPNRWLALVKDGKINYKLEHDYYVEKFYTPALKRLAKLNPAAAQAVSTSRALQEAYWSTAVQHGAYGEKYGAPGIFSRTYKPGMDVPTYLRAIYADRSLRFKDPKVMKGIRNRFKEELSSMLYLHQTYGNQVASTTPSAGGAAGGAMTGAAIGASAGNTTGAGMPIPAGADAPGAVPGGNNVTLTMSGNTGAGGASPMAGTTFIPSGPVDMSGLKLQPGIDFENLHPAVKQRFAAMAKEYKAMFGKPVIVTSGKRSLEKQAELYRTLPRGKAAKPNPLAPHICGLALDANSADMNKADSSGLLAKYGLWRPLKDGLGSCPKEAWHVEIQGSRDPKKRVITEGTLASINAAYAASAPNPNASMDQSTTGASLMDTSADGIQSQSPLQQARIDGVGSGGSLTGTPTIGGSPTGGPSAPLGGTSGGATTIASAGGASAGGTSAAAPAAGGGSGGSLAGAAPAISTGASSSAPAAADAGGASVASGAPAPTVSSVSTVSTFPSSSAPSISSNTISQTGQISAPIENNSQLEELKIISQLLSSIRSDMKDYYTKLEAQSVGGMIDSAKAKAGELADQAKNYVKSGELEKDATKLGNNILEGAGQAKDALVGALMDVIKSAKAEMNAWENNPNVRANASKLYDMYQGYTEPIDMGKHYPK